MGKRKEEDNLKSLFLTKKWFYNKKPSVLVLFSFCSTYIKPSPFIFLSENTNWVFTMTGPNGGVLPSSEASQGPCYSSADSSNCWARRSLWCPAVPFAAFIGYNCLELRIYKKWMHVKSFNKPIIKESHRGFSYHFKMHFVAARLWGWVQS